MLNPPKIFQKGVFEKSQAGAGDEVFRNRSFGGGAGRVVGFGGSGAARLGFTQADRERMVRMETTLQMFMESINRRFTEQRKDINQRFEQVMLTLQMIAAVFTAFFLAMLGYAWWDRRTIVRKAKEEHAGGSGKTEESRKNALVEQVVAEVIRRLESRKAALSQPEPLPATS